MRVVAAVVGSMEEVASGTGAEQGSEDSEMEVATAVGLAEGGWVEVAAVGLAEGGWVEVAAMVAPVAPEGLAAAQVVAEKETVAAVGLAAVDLVAGAWVAATAMAVETATAGGLGEVEGSVVVMAAGKGAEGSVVVMAAGKGAEGSVVVMAAGKGAEGLVGGLVVGGAMEAATARGRGWPESEALVTRAPRSCPHSEAARYPRGSG